MASAVDCPTSPVSKVSDDDGSEKITYDITDTDEDDSDEITCFTDSDEDGGPFDMETTCPGLSFTKEQEEEIRRKWFKGYVKLCADYAASYNKLLFNEDVNEDAISSIPPAPLKVLPETTSLCIKRGYCYHREYMTNETNETSQTLGFHEPKDMIQVLSLRLTHTESCPISVYGMFAIRDDLEPLRNYVFNRTRDDPVMIDKDSFALPLCSPCRGMHVLDRALLEVNLRMKKGGDGSTDEQLLSVYVEINAGCCLDERLTGRIHGDSCMLDMSYMLLRRCVETTIQVSAHADSSCQVRFIAFSSCFDHDIILFKGKGVKKGELFRHVVAVKVNEKLSVRLELDDSVFEWTYQDGAVVSSSDDLIMSQFQVRVFFAPKERAPVTSRYLDWKIRCRG